MKRRLKKSSGQQAAITGSTQLNELTPIDELSGKLSADPEEKRLMRSVLESDEEVINDGKLITAAINTGIGAFTPDMLFDKLVTNYKTAKKIYGKSFLQEIAGYGESTIERNLHIGEFRHELKKRIKDRLDRLKSEGLIDREGTLTEKAMKLSKVILYTEELDKLAARGLLGEREHVKSYSYGMKDGIKPFRHGRYRDIAVRKTVKLAVRRQHSQIEKNDLVAYERESKGRRNIIYALDASGSMKGSKLIQCKKAGIALAYKATEEKDKIGLIVFGKEVKSKTTPTNNFRKLLDKITGITAREKTNIAATVKEAVSMFPREDATKHLIMITDAMPTMPTSATSGETPEKETLEAVSAASDKGITISVIGINLKKEGQEIAERIAEIGKGRLFKVRDLEDMDKIVLEDYYSTA
ncbi:VWA domain-containing protein [Candidatus Woesearchaeota archaeon]|nr:VWA domain-containing protein [Candidatus Woesearchaeota archaeon]